MTRDVHKAVEGMEVESRKEEKKRYEKPSIEEHRIIDRVGECSITSSAYVSGYGYYH
jgi:hypothetical protein